jgi:hydrophobic/amphiphilic exporter-1 (mainly G- bacteria), HAE1 family
VIRLVAFFVERYVFAVAIFLAVVFFGLSAGSRLGVDLLPEFEFPIVAVSTSYPGAGSAETAIQISEPLEDAVATLAGITDVSSISGEGFSFVIAQFEFDVSVDQAAIDVKQRVDQVAPTLPDDASAPVIQKFDPADQPILTVALSAPGESLESVQRFASDVLETRLQQVLGVAAVSTIGPVQRELQVLLDPSRLQALGLSAGQVAGAIRAASITLPAGGLDLGSERLLLSVRAQQRTSEDVAEAFVDPARGVRVRDVATVRDTLADATRFVRLDGEPTVLLEVRKASGANSVATGQAVRAALERVALPEGYRATVVGDTTTFIANSVRDTMRETMLAVLAVAFIVMLFVGRVGSTFSVVLAIPITITGAVVVFGLLGFTFNVVTLLAITVAVGLVVDDSIVIAENIERYRALGYGLKDSVLKGAAEVSTAVLTSTLSLLAVFLPIAFLPGVIGQFFSQFGLSLAATIVVSYLEAMFFLTVRLAYLPNPLPPSWREWPDALRALPGDARWGVGQVRRRRVWLLAAVSAVAAPFAASEGLLGGTAQRAAEPWWGALAVGALAALGVLLALPLLAAALRVLLRLAWATAGAALRALHEATDLAVRRAREGYGRALGWTLEHTTPVLVSAFVMILSAVAIVPFINFNFLSEVDVGQVSVRLDMPPGTPLDRTDAVTARLEGVARADNDVRSVVTTVGSGGTFGNPNPQRGRVQLELLPIAQRSGSSAEVANRLRPALEAAIADVPEARLRVSADDGGAVPVDTGVQLTLRGTDLALLERRDRAARDLMEQHPWLTNARSSLEGSVSERVFVVSGAAVAGTGLTTNDIANTLRAYNVGVSAGRLRDAGQETPILVKVDPALVRDEQTLLSLPIFAPGLQSFVQLGQLGGFEVQAAPVAINRANGAYVTNLNADLSPASPGQFQTRAEIERLLAAAGVVDADVQVTTGLGPDLLGDLVFYGPIAFVLAILLNYLVIASQFNSFRYPLYLLLPVPLALVGAFWLFFLTQTPLDVISVLGVVILIGLVTKNAILLLDVVVSQLERSETLEQALVRAGKLRLRPILMTALTVLIISVPLLLGVGEGTEFRRPLGLVILGGVVSSTFLTLFVVPAAFYRFERGRYARAAELAAAAETAGAGSATEPTSPSGPAGEGATTDRPRDGRPRAPVRA